VRKIFEDRFKYGMLPTVDTDRRPLFISPLPAL
jgi:hypothetical protein